MYLKSGQQSKGAMERAWVSLAAPRDPIPSPEEASPPPAFLPPTGPPGTATARGRGGGESSIFQPEDVPAVTNQPYDLSGDQFS